MKLIQALLCIFAISSGAASTMELVQDDLPEIDDLLKELGLIHLAEKFYSSGFTETKYILRMKEMDMRIMAMEWGVEKDAIKRVKEAIVNYKVEREVFVEEEDPLLAVRNSLSYGKLVVRRATTSYEYYTAFNSAPMVTIITRDLQFLLILTAPPPNDFS
jgi:MoaA/NifB/PqqE/SkfB family radical SAM enzyme